MRLYSTRLAWGVRVRHTLGIPGDPFFAGVYFFNPETWPAKMDGYRTSVFKTRAKAREAAKKLRHAGQEASAVRVRVTVEEV